MGGARRYVTLFEAPFQASVLNDSENNALRASSLMAIPPLPPGSQPLADIKELTPLQFMPYVAKLFREVTGRDLSGLSHFTGWIGIGGYYHWRVVQQGLVHQVHTSQGSQPPGLPTPILVVNHFRRSRPKPRLHPREPLASSRTGVSQPPAGADRNPPRARADGRPPLARAE